MDRAGGSLLLNPLQPRPLTKGQRASASWAPRQPRGEEPPAKQETCSSPGLGRPHVRWSLWSTARGAATMRSHCSLQQRRPGQQQRPSTAKIKNAKHPRTEIRVAIKGKIQRFHLRGSPVLPHDGNARHPESLSLLDSAHFYLSREQQVTTPACTEESLARRPPGPEPSAHVGALKGGGPPGAQTPLRACSPMLTVLVRDDGAPGPAQAEGIPGAPKHPSSGGRSPVPPRAQRPSGHVTRAPRMQTRCPGPGRAGGQAPPCCPQAWRSGQAAPQVNVWQVNPTGRPGSRPTSNHRMAWKPWGGPPLPPAELAHLSVPPHTHSPPRLTGEGPSEAPSVPQLGLTPHADPPRGLHACHLPCSWLPLTSFDAPDGSTRWKLNPGSVHASGDQGRVGRRAPDSAGRSAQRSGSCSLEETGRPCHDRGRAFRRAWGGGRDQAGAEPRSEPCPPRPRGQQLLRLRVWGSARVSGKAPRLRARGAPEGQLAHDGPLPPPSMGGLHRGAADGGTRPSRGGQGTARTAAPPANLVVSPAGHSLSSPYGHSPRGGLSSKSPGARTRSFRSHDTQS